MMPRLFLFAMILSLIPCWNAAAQERTLFGEVLAAPMQVDVKGSGAKFNEYRDLRDGVYGHIDLHHEAGENYLDFRADHMGYKDQQYELEGGRRGSFTYYLGYNELPHNFTHGAKVQR